MTGVGLKDPEANVPGTESPAGQTLGLAGVLRHHTSKPGQHQLSPHQHLSCEDISCHRVQLLTNCSQGAAEASFETACVLAAERCLISVS